MTSSPSWDPGQYQRFAAERARPFTDLVAQIPTREPRAVVDLGCGPGTVTATLADRWPHAFITGFDSSPDMVEAARKLAVPGRLEFSLGDVTACDHCMPFENHRPLVVCRGPRFSLRQIWPGEKDFI